MLKSMRTTHPLAKIINGSLVDLPSPSSISYLWNFGSLLGLCLATQIATGLFLAMHYSADIIIAFENVVYISENVSMGWPMRVMHANGASVFFICLYMHVGRGIYYGSYMLEITWTTGVALLLLVMMTAFVGYVLPWGQMSFWGATVITNLLSAIPYIGTPIVQWLWGGFAVDNATLTRFFAFHFILPFVIAAMVILHLLFLHQTGSNNPSGLSKNMDSMPFHPFFSYKDILGVSTLMLLSLSICFMAPYYLGDAENFIPANPLVTPIHIKPEWYFLFAYAILRSIPNKLGGVMALVFSILILLTLPLSMKRNHATMNSYWLTKSIFWILVVTVMLLTWIGARPVESPLEGIGQIFTVIYFLIYIILPLSSKFNDMVT